MKAFLVSIVFAISSFAFSAIKAPSFTDQVTKKLNNLFADTINEGAVRAQVARVKGKPDVKCGNIVRSGSKAIIFCTAKIKTTFYSRGKKQNGSTICTSLSYVIKNNKVAERFREEAFSMCMENIHDASYN